MKSNWMFLILITPLFGFSQTKKTLCRQPQALAKEFLFLLRNKDQNGIKNLMITLQERLELVRKDSINSSYTWNQNCIKLCKIKEERSNETFNSSYKKVVEWASASSSIIKDSRLLKIVEECRGCSECGIDLLDLVIKLKYKKTEFEIKLYNCSRIGNCWKTGEYFDIYNFSIPITY